MRTVTLAALVSILPAVAAAQGSSPATKPGAPAQPGTSAHAPTAQQPVPPAATQLSRQLVSQQRWDEILSGYATALSGQVSRALSSKGEQVPSDLQGTMRKELGQRLPYQQTVDAQASALAKEFTPDELKKILAFYQTPAGKKLLDRMPKVQDAVGQQLDSQLAVAVPEIVQRVAPQALQPGSPSAPERSGTGSSGPGPSGSPEEGATPPAPVPAPKK